MWDTGYDWGYAGGYGIWWRYDGDIKCKVFNFQQNFLSLSFQILSNPLIKSKCK